MQNNFRDRLHKGELLVGTVVSLGSPEVAEILANCGFDWLFLDAEHAPQDSLILRRMLQSIAGKSPCLVRLASGDEVSIKQALDIGATGIIAPMVNSAEQAQQVVSYAKYPPLGQRGVGPGRAHGYGMQFQEYVLRANQETVVVMQVEHIRAVEDIEAIVKVEGVDAVLIGPYDLSASLGRMGEVEHPDVTAAVKHVTQTCQQAGMPLGVFGMTAAAVQPYINNGYTLIVVGTDAVTLGTAAHKLLADVRGG